MKKLVFFKVLSAAAVATVILTSCGGKDAKDAKDAKDTKDTKDTPSPVTEEFTDSRDGKTYKKVTIGNQTWMAENLNFAAEGSKCYGNNAGTCDMYGRLYNWAAALKACPAGYHLPNDEEWTALENAVGGRSIAGTKLKSAAGWNEDGNGTNDYGWSALPGGGGYSKGSFFNAGYYGVWWSATEDGALNARHRNMFYLNDFVYVGWYLSIRADLFSVRCVQDT
jgi:uncharacterized protein (TIGR02145 family)